MVLQNTSIKKVTRMDDWTQGKVTQMESRTDGRPDPGKSDAEGQSLPGAKFDTTSHAKLYQSTKFHGACSIWLESSSSLLSSPNKWFVFWTSQ
jgi:hypothetical protein